MCNIQFLRKRRGGLPAFRRLLGKTILHDVRLQDVVFASEINGKVIDASEIATRSRVPLKELDRAGKIAERKDLSLLRDGTHKYVWQIYYIYG